MEEKNLELLVRQVYAYQTFCLSNDQKILYYVTKKFLNALDVQSMSIAAEIPFPDEVVFVGNSKMCISYDDKYICATTKTKNGNNTYAVCRFDVENKIFLDFIEQYHFMWIDHIQFIPNTYMFVSLDKNKNLKFLNIYDKQPTQQSIQVQEDLISISFVQKSQRCILIDNFSNIQLRDFKKFRLQRRFSLKQKKGFYFAKVIADGHIIMIGYPKMFIFSIQKQRLIRKCQRYDNSNYVLLSETYLFYLTSKAISIVNINTLEHHQIKISSPDSFCQAVLSKDSNSLLIASLHEIFIIRNLLK